MSIVLCSLLIGVGYNAFVVVGYAPAVSGRTSTISFLF
jgi:hypothetical protein